MSNEKHLENFLSYIRVDRGLSEKTARAYTHDLNRFFDFLRGSHDLDVTLAGKNEIRAFLGFLAGETNGKVRNANVTRARKLATLKSFYKFLLRDGVIDRNPAEEVETPKVPEKEPCYLTIQEYERLLNTIRVEATPWYHARDIAIVTTLLGTGIRLSELVGLNDDSINLESGEIKVLGKGNKERTIPLNEGVVEAIQRYLPTRPDIPLESLFISRLGGRLSDTAVYRLVKKYLKLSGINKSKLSVHSLRHSFGASLLEKDVNLVVIQTLMGHKKLETTRRYLHIKNADLRTAVEKINLSKV